MTNGETALSDCLWVCVLRHGYTSPVLDALDLKDLMRPLRPQTTNPSMVMPGAMPTHYLVTSDLPLLC